MRDAASAPIPSHRVCLTVLVPRSVEDRVVDWLLAHTRWDIEFSAHAVAARGPLVHLAMEEERVQGFAHRVELKLILQRDRLEALLEALLPLLAGVEGGYWVLPIEHFAAFDPAPPSLGATG
jgi:hypothetical protein